MTNKSISADDFYAWLDTCPVHWRHYKTEEDYTVIGFFEVVHFDEDEQ